MAFQLKIPGRERLDLEILLVDVNGTLTYRGELIDGVLAGLEALKEILDIRLLSADTFGTLDAVARALGVDAQVAASAQDKLDVLEALGAGRCVAVGNGANDAAMLARAGLGVAVVGPEGASAAASLRRTSSAARSARLSSCCASLA